MCENLQVAPALPATTLAQGCYDSMFYECAALTTSPVLSATILSDFCYNSMFNECESLSHITMLATDISADDCLNEWVNGVAAAGTFVKAASMTSLPTGTSGIPSDWTVQNAT